MLLVNKEKVSQALLEREYQNLLPQYKHVFRDKPEEEQEKELREWARLNVIEKVLLKQVARKRKDSVSPKEIKKRFDEYARRSGGEEKFKAAIRSSNTSEEEVLKEIDTEIRVEHLLGRIGKRAPVLSDEDLEKFYNDNPSQFMIPEMVHAAHIVKHVKNPGDKENALRSIQEAKKALDSGKTFEEIAGSGSDCPERNGDLGFFGRGQMVQVFEDIVFGMKPGEISDIFETEFGYHIAKVYEKVLPHPRPFSTVKDELARKLHGDMVEKEKEKYIDSLVAKAVIENISDDSV